MQNFLTRVMSTTPRALVDVVVVVVLIGFVYCVGRYITLKAKEGRRMADIEERAEKWAREYVASLNVAYFKSFPAMAPVIDRVRGMMVEAYLAGSAQAQADYSADDCSRCVCTCGAR